MTGMNFKTHSGMLCHNIYYGSGFRVLSRAIPKLVGILRRKAAAADFFVFSLFRRKTVILQFYLSCNQIAFLFFQEHILHLSSCIINSIHGEKASAKKDLLI